MKHVVRLKEFLWPYRLRYIQGTVSLILCAACRLAIPRVFKMMLERLERYEAGPEELAFGALAIVGLSLGGSIFRFLRRWCLYVAARRVERDLRRRFVAHLLSLSSSFFDTAKVGDLMARATNDVKAVRILCGNGVGAGLQSVFLASASLVMMFTLDVRLALILLVPMPILAVAMLVLSRHIHKRAQACQAAFADMSAAVQENVVGIRVVKDFSQEDFEQEHFETLNSAYFDRTMEKVRVTAAVNPAILFVLEVAFALVLLVGGWSVMMGEMTFGAFIAFIAYIELLVYPMASLGWVVNAVQQGSAAMGRLVELLDTQPSVTDGPGVEARRRDGTSPAVEVRNLTFSYDDERAPALRNVNITVPWGGTLGVVGRTGSGSTTLVRLLLRLYSPPPGTVVVDGSPVGDFTLSQLRALFAVVPQDGVIFSGSVRENVTFGDPRASDERVRWALEQAGFLAEVDALSEGLDTVIGERGVTLSGGQQQRLSIARALLLDAPILILDDCLSAVDSETEGRILANLSSLMGTGTAIIVSNRIAAVARTDEVVVFDQGAIIERGTHDELVELGGLYADLHRRQQVEERMERS